MSTSAGTPTWAGFQRTIRELKAATVRFAGDSGDGMQLTGSLAVLVALNPAALITNLSAVVPDGLLLVNEDSFTDKDLKLAGCYTNPLEDGSLVSYRLVRIPMTTLTRKSVEDLGLSTKLADRCNSRDVQQCHGQPGFGLGD